MNNVKTAAFFMAACIFFDSTALGIKAMVYTDFNLLQRKVKLLVQTKNQVQLAKASKSITATTLLTSPKIDGGPDQPEVQSFTPMNVSNMVDPFSGDFSYNIPLMDVDGYPINIAYSAGVTMDQEASWVGLGWNLNPGVINRSMRGVPDEYNGTEKITKEMNLKRNWTLGGSISGDYELFGFGDAFTDPTISTDTNFTGSFNLNASLGVNYNNYSGFSSSFSLGINSSGIGLANNLSMSAGLGFSGSSTGGASVTPSFGLQYKQKSDSERESVTHGLNLGTSINSRGGLANTSIGYTRTHKKNELSPMKSRVGDITSVNKTLPIRSSYNFGLSTYTPAISMPMSTAGGTFSFKLGGDITGNDLSGEFSGFYTEQWLKEKTKYENAYGYMHLHNAQNNPDAMLDFNRENDGTFTKNVPALPIPNLTYDIFSVSGQGVAGSYRAVRKDIGYVFDAQEKVNSINGSLGTEINLGGTFKGGIDVASTFTSSRSGAWNDFSNGAANRIKFINSPVYFREANEMAVDADPNHFNKIGGSKPVYFNVASGLNLENKLENIDEEISISESNYNKMGEDKRNQVLYTLSVSEVKQGLAIQDIHQGSFVANTADYDHHIGEFTVLNTEGARYVYGVPAYSIKQKNVSFAIGATPNLSTSPQIDYLSGLVNYNPGTDNSADNDKGIDNYYNAVSNPPFAHSYLLSTVLNADYVDADNIKGPSKGDLGGYLSFSYNSISNYKWRNPIEKNKASYDEGFHTDLFDDKAHYISGEKELYYVQKISSKNHIAVFYTSDREDALSVIDENGGLDANGPSMQKLDSIQLFSLPEYEANSNQAIPLKTVHFQYDYSLCPQYAGNINGQGKLTLKSIFFTYQGSNKGRYTPYNFQYGQRFSNAAQTEIINPAYNMKNIDRWNNYKKQGYYDGNVAADELRPSDFPYVGFDKLETDKAATAWNLTTIFLPSGGKMEVDYESDDYGFVQHKRANQMFKIIGVQSVAEANSTSIVTQGETPISEDENKNAAIYVELMPDANSTSGYNENIAQYVKPGQQIYFRALMRFPQGKYDFVPGYANVSDELSDLQIVQLGSQKALRIKLKGAKLKDNGSADYNPISVAAIQFGRIHLSKFIPPSSNSSVDENANLPSLADALAGAFTSYTELFTGPNKALWLDNIGNNIVVNHSWVRLQNPDQKKLGGGHRVKQIRMYDAWAEMTGSNASYFYGQNYYYSNDNGTSSGVAAYEPQIGGDENPFKQPVTADNKLLLAPDEKNYSELPFGEQFFPSPRVGYAKVTIADIPRAGVTRTATGKVVHEFYTAREFPTFATYTNIDKERNKLPIFYPFFSAMIDEMTASQGFVIENNDMHGKAKSQSIYAADQTEPISQVLYYYKSENTSLDGIPVKKLKNVVSTIKRDGTLAQNTIGLNYDAYADFRQNLNSTINGSVNFNTNFTAPFILIPTIAASGSFERTAFRSATFTKVIERFGLQDSTVAIDLKSRVNTANLAYDAETGTVLLTRTATNFNDEVYNFTYPAHWYYSQMGQAFQNIGYEVNNISFVNGGTSQVTSSRFTRGDEVSLLIAGTGQVTKAWVTEANESGIHVLLKNGDPVQGLVLNMKVLRSGRKNLQTTPVGNITLRSNPMNNLQSNLFEQVLQAGAVEYSDDWRTFCECFLNNSSSNYTTNPYVLGTRGTWRPITSHVYLSGRTQAFLNNNSDIRNDGMFTSFTPFYKWNAGKWNIDKQNWTYASSVVEFSPFGQALETVDALDRYSSSMFGYNQTLAIAVAVNTRYKQLGYDGFEDYQFQNCSDNHFRFSNPTNIISTEAHTGHNSVKVTPQNSVVFTNTFNTNCDDSPCDIKLLVKVEGDNKETKSTNLFISGGQLPYAFDYQVLQGNPTVEISEDGSSLLIKENQPSNNNQKTIKIFVSDANGCQKIIEL